MVTREKDLTTLVGRLRLDMVYFHRMQGEPQYSGYGILF